ncbi:UDP-glycosyltransferase 74B1-like [Camellia sinensis]|uniref:Glycosyltransferase n=1 Tax=Camellia sinensis TaxID=4442 RepID=A0A0X9FHF9_CAMSI|nr:UDP-glycosyltransferase 74B1-like [Camellia sinensis]ALO19896.1 UDP-glycosyltransferase 74B5 [Camellia sinensis]
MEQRNHGGHVVVLPYPSQGHINPLLQFAKRLASKGVKATLATTHYTVKSICVPNIAVEPISDGFDNGGFTQARAEDVYLKSLRENGSRTLSQLIEKHKNTNFPINCVVYDSFFPWALDVAKTHGIYGAPFFTNSATVCAIFCHVHHGLVKLPVKVEELPLVLPGIPPLNLVDLPSFVQAPESYPAYLAMKLSQYSNLDKADWVFGNTFEELEGEAVKNVLELWPGKMIGPMVPSAYLDGRIEEDKGYGASLWKPLSSDCAKWLEAKPSQSVVYVSFGSMVSLTEEQMEEMAWGLKGSNLDFIWVVRESEITKLPSEFTNSTAQEKGLIVTWCNQLEMLAHQAIGCFVTHCGWNSTLEGLSLGVPMVGVPKWTDQLTDAKFIEEIWGVGFRAKEDEKGVVRREELMGCLKEVMEGERSVEIRKNCCKWKELAKEAISEGGSSDKSIDEFVEQLKSGNEKGVVKYLTNGNGHY